MHLEKQKKIRFGIYRNRTFIDRNNERGRQCSSKNNVRLKCKPSKKLYNEIVKLVNEDEKQQHKFNTNK